MGHSISFLQVKTDLGAVREERWSLAQRCFLCIPVFSDLDRFQYGSIFEHRA